MNFQAITMFAVKLRIISGYLKDTVWEKKMSPSSLSLNEKELYKVLLEGITS